MRRSGTYTGHYEPVKEMADFLDEYESRTGNSVPIHGWFSYVTENWFTVLIFDIVDAASGGFVAPFVSVCT